jgi:hypothetical protein
MDLISHKEFGKLRLNQFLESNQIESRDNWQFMEDLWFGEAHVFTEFLRLYKSPFKTKSIAISLDTLEETVYEDILFELGLPLKKGMGLDEISNHLPAPIGVFDRVQDRISYKYIIGEEEQYYLSCTVLNEGGLVYIVMMNHKKSIKALER